MDNIKELQEIVAQQAEKITELEIKLLGKEAAKAALTPKAPVLPKTPFDYKGKKYLFKFPAFHFNTERYTAEEAQFNPQLVKQILETPGQNLIKEVY